MPCPPAGDLSDPAIKSPFLTSSTLVDGSFATSATWEAQKSNYLSTSRERLQYFTWCAPTDEVQLNTNLGPWIYVKNSVGVSETGQRTRDLQPQAILEKNNEFDP